MKGLFRSYPLLVSAVVVLLLLAILLFYLNWHFFPDHYFNIIKLLGAKLFGVSTILFIALLVTFVLFIIRASYFASLLFALIAILQISYGTVLLHRVVMDQIHVYIQQLVDQTADLVKVEVQSQMKFRMFALSRLTKSWELTGQQPSKENWSYDAQKILDFFPGLQAIEWVDANYKVRWVVPLEGNEKIVNLDARTAPGRKNALKIAKLNHEMAITHSIDLIHGDRGFIVYMPVYAGGKFDGYVLGIISYKKLFGILLSQDIVPGYSISAHVESEKVFERGELDPKLKHRWKKSVNLKIKDLPFQFDIWPNRELVGQEGALVSSLMTFVGVVMSLFVLMATVLVLLMQRNAGKVAEANRRLQQEMVERKQAEEARSQMRAALLQSQKLEAIGTLAGGIAHNFNNILYSIQGYTQMMRDDADKSSREYRNLGKMLEGLKQGQELVAGIMSFCRQDTQQFEVLSVKAMLESSLDLLKATLPATAEITVVNSLIDEKVQGCHAQLQQVVMNLVKNAVDAMNHVGEVTVKAYVTELNDDLKMRCPGLVYPAYIVIEVSDNGIGMDEKVRERIFEPFFTTKDVGDGTGLGLATARSIIEEHNGELAVISEVGKGSTFYIYIPKYEK